MFQHKALKKQVVENVFQTLMELGLYAALAVTLSSVALAVGSRFASNWLWEIFAQFWLQYGLILLTLTLIQWYRRRWLPMALSGLTTLLFLPVFFSTVPRLFFSSPPSSAVSTRVMFANVLFENTDYSRVIQQIHTYHPDIVVLAEIPTSLDAQIQQQVPELPNHYLVTHDFVAFQLAIYSRVAFTSPPRSFSVAGVDEPGLDTTIELLGGAPLRLIGIHPTPPFSERWSENRDRFMSGLAQSIRSEAVPTLLVGDFNNTPNSPSFQKFLTESGLRDSRNGWGWQGSWPNFFPEFLRIPIDHALYSDGVKIVHRQLGGQNGSDHLPIVLDISAKQP